MVGWVHIFPNSAMSGVISGDYFTCEGTQMAVGTCYKLHCGTETSFKVLSEGHRQQDQEQPPSHEPPFLLFTVLKSKLPY